MSIVFGCKEHGRRSEGPFDHGTGKGRANVKERRRHMGIRRVEITFAAHQSPTARTIYDILSQDVCLAFDVTLRHDGGGGKSIIEFVAASQEVRALIAFLGEKAGVGTEYGGSVTISDINATLPPIDQRIAQRTVLEELTEPSATGLLASSPEGSAPSPPSPRRQKSNQTVYQAFTREEARARMTYDEILRQIEDSSKLTFDYIGMILAAAAIAATGLVQDSSVTVVASMLLSPLMSPILAITFGLAVGHDGIMRRGMRNELIGVLITLAVGIAAGASLAPIFGPHAFNSGELDPHRNVDGEVWAQMRCVQPSRPPAGTLPVKRRMACLHADCALRLKLEPLMSTLDSRALSQWLQHQLALCSRERADPQPRLGVVANIGHLHRHPVRLRRGPRRVRRRHQRAGGRGDRCGAAAARRQCGPLLRARVLLASL